MSRGPRSASARRSLGSDDSQTPILHVDMDAFFVEVELLALPEVVQVGALFGGPAAGRRVPLRRGTHDPTLRATTRSAPGRTVSVNGSAAIGSPSAIATGGSAPRAGACSIVTVRAR